MYPKKMLDYDNYLAQNQCPENDILCNEQAVWIPQNVLLSAKTDMDDIFHAIEKIQVNAEMIKTKNL